jgi:hypothetical protein
MQGIFSYASKGNDLRYQVTMCGMPLADDSLSIFQKTKMAKAVC